MELFTKDKQTYIRFIKGLEATLIEDLLPQHLQRGEYQQDAIHQYFYCIGMWLTDPAVFKDIKQYSKEVPLHIKICPLLQFYGIENKKGMVDHDKARELLKAIGPYWDKPMNAKVLYVSVERELGLQFAETLIRDICEKKSITGALNVYEQEILDIALKVDKKDAKSKDGIVNPKTLKRTAQWLCFGNNTHQAVLPINLRQLGLFDDQGRLDVQTERRIVMFLRKHIDDQPNYIALFKHLQCSTKHHEASVNNLKRLKEKEKQMASIADKYLGKKPKKSYLKKMKKKARKK